MNINERHEFITRQLEAKGQVSVTELSTLLNVSEVTIRKDLSILEKNNLLYRAHGKAIKLSPYINDRDVNVKEHQFPAEKTATFVQFSAISSISCDTTMMVLHHSR